MRRLNRTILSGGVMYPAGQAATPELEEAITNPAFWDDDAYVAAPEPAVVPEPLSQATTEVVDDPPAPPPADPPPPEPVDYSTWKYDKLVDAVKARNESRDEEHHLKPSSRKGEDLAAALAADDLAYPQA